MGDALECTCDVRGPDYDDVTTDPKCPAHGDDAPMVLRVPITSARPPGRPEKPPVTSWIIDCCATCGRHATWPFCEHQRSDRPWTLAVAVKVMRPGEFAKAWTRGPAQW